MITMSSNSALHARTVSRAASIIQCGSGACHPSCGRTHLRAAPEEAPGAAVDSPCNHVACTHLPWPPRPPLGVVEIGIVSPILPREGSGERGRIEKDVALRNPPLTGGGHVDTAHGTRPGLYAQLAPSFSHKNHTLT